MRDNVLTHLSMLQLRKSVSGESAVPKMVSVGSYLYVYVSDIDLLGCHFGSIC